MLDIHETSRHLSVYADQEPWRKDHDEAQSCFALEDKLAWGVSIYEGLLNWEARSQLRALKRPSVETSQLLDSMPVFYQLWTRVSEFYLDRAQEFVKKGYEVAGFDEFQATVEEARCLLGNVKLEEQIRPIEELIVASKPSHPNPKRYGG